MSLYPSTFLCCKVQRDSSTTCPLRVVRRRRDDKHRNFRSLACKELCLRYITDKGSKTSELGTGTCSRNMWLCHGQPVRASACSKKRDSLSKWQSQPVERRNKSESFEIRKQRKPYEISQCYELVQSSQSVETDWLSPPLPLPWPFRFSIRHTGGSAPIQNRKRWQWKWSTKTKQKQVQNDTRYECKGYMWKNHCNEIMSSCKGHISDLNVFIGHWMPGLTMESAGWELAASDFDLSMNKGNCQLDLRSYGIGELQKMPICNIDLSVHND